MDIRGKFEAQIRKKEQEMQEYTREYEAKMREAKAYIQGIQDSLRMIPRYEVNTEEKANITLRPGRNVHKAWQLLKKHGEPMQLKDLIEGIGLKYNKSTRGSLGGTIGAYERKKQIFKRVGPNTFGLREWDNSAPKEEAPTFTRTKFPAVRSLLLDKPEPEEEVISKQE